MSSPIKTPFEVPGATLEFFTYKQDGITYIEYDATECTPPEPMVNTIYALKMINDKNTRLVGRFFHEPFPLYERVKEAFSYSAKELETGDFEVVFRKK